MHVLEVQYMFRLDDYQLQMRHAKCRCTLNFFNLYMCISQTLQWHINLHLAPKLPKFCRINTPSLGINRHVVREWHWGVQSPPKRTVFWFPETFFQFSVSLRIPRIPRNEVSCLTVFTTASHRSCTSDSVVDHQVDLRDLDSDLEFGVWTEIWIHAQSAG